MSDLGQELEGYIRAAVTSEPTKFGGAQFLRDIAQVVYDTVRRNSADREVPTSPNAPVQPKVVDPARQHWSQSTAEQAGSSPPVPASGRTG